MAISFKMSKCICIAVYYIIGSWFLLIIAYKAEHPVTYDDAFTRLINSTTSDARGSDVGSRILQLMSIFAAVATCIMTLALLFLIITIIKLVEKDDQAFYLLIVWLCIHISYTLMAPVALLICVNLYLTKEKQMVLSCLSSLLNLLITSGFLVQLKSYVNQLKFRLNNTVQGVQEVSQNNGQSGAGAGFL
jgi:hypothetical protein